MSYSSYSHCPDHDAPQRSGIKMDSSAMSNLRVYIHGVNCDDDGIQSRQRTIRKTLTCHVGFVLYHDAKNDDQYYADIPSYDR